MPNAEPMLRGWFTVDEHCRAFFCLPPLSRVRRFAPSHCTDQLCGVISRPEQYLACRPAGGAVCVGPSNRPLRRGCKRADEGSW